MYVIMKIFITNKQFDKTEKIGIGTAAARVSKNEWLLPVAAQATENENV
jgi:hypothetical protein